VLHGTEEDVSRALSEHLHRYKLSVDQARAAHPDYFIGNGDTW
jgi:GntR family transcriptional regulator, rspAB operon transcriptional repressor